MAEWCLHAQANQFQVHLCTPPLTQQLKQNVDGSTVEPTVMYD